MKNEKIAIVSEQTLKTILQHGLKAVTFSRISEATGVSRGWLYKYVGKNPEALIRAAALHFGALAARLGEPPPPAQDRESYLAHLLWSLERLSQIAAENPWFLPLYHRYKGSATLLGEAISQVEARLSHERTQDVERCIRDPKLPPKILAELIVAVDLALAFQWQHTDPKSLENIEKLKKTARILFDGIL